MLTWYDTPERDETGAVISMSYKAGIPHWGEAHIHPHPDHPGEAVLDCPELGIRMHSLGRVTAEDTISPAERVLLEALEQRGCWCLEALAAIGYPDN